MAALRYTIVVMGPAYGTQQSSCAYQFVSTLLSTSPHLVEHIFFYGDGIYNANQFTQPASDEFNLITAWQTLAKQYNLNLDVCVSAALRRGVVQETTEDNLAEGFRLSGLGALSEAMANCDRVIQF